MRFWASLFLSFVLLGAVGGTAGTVDAANISDLRDSYSGPAHSLSNQDNEESNFSFDVQNRQPNGKFEAVFGNAGTAPGKVTPKGKFSFSGRVVDDDPPTDIKLKASGQLSASGQFITGQISLKGAAGAVVVDEVFTFDVEGNSVKKADTGSGLPGLGR